MISKDVADEGRDLLISRWAEVDDGDTALLLSGGVDSVTALFAALANGRRPHCYTFFLSGYKSTDLAAARNIARRFELELTEVGIPGDLDSLIQDCLRIIGDEVSWEFYPGLRKVTVQTVHPLLYLREAVTEKRVIAGLGGDKLALCNRSDSISVHHGGDDAADDLRCDRRSVDDNFYQYVRTFDRAGIEYVDFFDFTAIYRWVRRIAIQEFNRPKVKWGLVYPFLDYWQADPLYRTPTPYQIASGLRTFHDRLLDTKWNKHDSTEVVRCYRTMAASLRVRFGREYYFPVQPGPWRFEVETHTPRIQAFWDAASMAEF